MEVLPTLLSFPPHPPPHTPLTNHEYHAGMVKHLDALRKLGGKIASDEGIFDVLDPSANTVAYALVLQAYIKADSLPFTALFPRLVNFLDYFDPRQVRYVGREYAAIIHKAAVLAERTRQLEYAVVSICNAILKVDPAGSTFTTFHTLVARLALNSHSTALALPLLDRPVLYFPSSANQSKGSVNDLPCDMDVPPGVFITVESGLTERPRYQDVLEYFTYTGTAYIWARDWEKALDALESAVTFPCRDPVPSKIMVEAYKKWTVVHALLHGKAGALPQMSAPTAKVFHTLAKPYEALANMFQHATAYRLWQEVEAGLEIWHEDYNRGLVTELLSAHQKFQIQKLATLYRTISISEVTLQTTSAESSQPQKDDHATRLMVEAMISEGQLHATLTETSGSSPIIVFKPSGLVLSEKQVQQEIAGTVARLKDLVEDVKATDRRLTQTPDYLRWSAKQKKIKSPGFSDLEDVDFPNGGIGEEDLMSSN